MSSISISIPGWLPDEARELLNKYICLDKIHILLKKRKMSGTTSNYRSFSSLFDEAALAKLLHHCPATISYDTIRGSGEPELQFKPSGSTSARETQRGRTVLATLIEMTKQQLMASYCRNPGESKANHKRRQLSEWQRVLTSGQLPEGFQLEIAPSHGSSSDLESETQRRPVGASVRMNPHEVYAGIFEQDQCIDARSLIDPLPHIPPSLLQRLSAEDRQVEQLAMARGVSGASAVLRRLHLMPWYEAQLVHKVTYPARDAKFSMLGKPLPAPLERALIANTSINVTRMFCHQVKAIDALREGKHVALATETSSGKSLTYNIPVIEAALADDNATSLYLFPTKALAQDQYRALQSLCGLSTDSTNIAKEVLPLRIGIIDGDSDKNVRKAAALGPRQGGPHIILTNPDMLHHTLLPENNFYKNIFVNLKFVVIDEAHQYRGTFGSHVACVLRRLTRICILHNCSRPQFICCSATISNPRELFSQLVYIHKEDELHVIESNEASTSKGERTFCVWNPPLKSWVAPIRDQPKKSKSDASCVNTSSNLADTSRDLPPENTELSIETSIQKSVAYEEAGIDDFLRSCEDRHRVPVSWQGLYGDKHKQHLKKRNRDEISSNTSLDMTELYCKGANEQQWPSATLSTSVKVVRSNASSINRESPIVEIARLLAFFVRLRLRTLCFCGTRRLVEMVNMMAKQELKNSYNAEHLVSSVTAYRGGYTSDSRRLIEKGLFSGSLLGVAATCALELGVDVGSLDVCLQLGFPGSFSSLWQQAGRAGRRGRPALNILVCWDSPIDQYFARNPDKLLSSPVESVLLGTQNPHIIRGHLLCAAKEEPLESEKLTIYHGFEEHHLWGNIYCSTRDDLISQGHLRREKQLGGEGSCILFVSAVFGDVHTYDKPQQSVNLRLIDPVSIDVVDETQKKVIDSMTYSRAFFEAFEGSVFYHQARQYLVTKLDLVAKQALCRSVRVNYTTTAKNDTIITVLRQTGGQGGILAFGIVSVVKKVEGFIKRSITTREIIEEGEFVLPPLEMETQAVWIDLPFEVRNTLQKRGFDVWASIHAANHALVTVAAIESFCDAGDLDCEHFDASSEDKRRIECMRLLLYDRRPGGLGFCERLLEAGSKTIKAALDVLNSCHCNGAVVAAKSKMQGINDEDEGEVFEENLQKREEEAGDFGPGCPACLFDPRCSRYNENLDKMGALLLLDLLHIEMSRSSAPTRSSPTSCSETLPNEGETFVQASLIRSPREEKRRSLKRQARYQDAHASRGLFITKPWMTGL